MGRRSMELPTGCYLEHGEGAVILHHPDGSVVGRLPDEGSEDGRNGASSLRVRFLGGFELLRDGEPMNLGQNGRATAILKYLIARMERGETREAVEFCYRVLEKDRRDEEAHRLLMECLGREWDMEPSPENRALHSGILEDRRRA